MKILVLAPHPFFQNRGTPIAVKMLLETLTASGHTITLLTFPEGEDVNISGCTVIRVKKLSWVTDVRPGFSWKKIIYDLFIYTNTKKLLQREQFDLIHAVEESAFIASWLGRKFNVPFVYDMDSSLPHQLGEKFFFLKPFLPLFQYMEKSVIKRAAGILPVCKAIEESVKKYDADVFCQRLEDVSLLPQEDEQLPQHADLHLDNELLWAMYVGNLEKYQGIDLLLDSFVIAIQQNEFVRLLIIGGSDPDIALYQDKCEKLGIQNNVRFVGRRPVTDLHHYLRQATILVSPRSKGFNTPMKIYSYLDSGRALLATNMPTHTQVLDDSIACLVEPSPDSMANGLIELMSNDQLRDNLADNAKQRAHAEFTPDAFKRKLNHFYDNLFKQ